MRSAGISSLLPNLLGPSYGAVDIRETETIAVEDPSSALLLDRVNLGPITYVQHASEADPFVAYAGVYRLAAQCNVRNRLKIAANEAKAAVRNV